MKRVLFVLTITIIIVILGLYYNGIALFEYTGATEGVKSGEIIDGPHLKKYVNSYTILSNGEKFIIYIPKSSSTFKYGDFIEFNYTYIKPAKQRNFGGFDYSLYLKTKRICGVFKINTVKKKYNIFERKTTIFQRYNKFINDTKEFIKLKIEQNMSKDNAQLLIGILIGDISNLSEEIQNNFRNASLTHMLAVSGDHFSYIILAVGLITRKIKNKRLGQFFTICIIVFFISITGATPSVLRAGIMSIMIILSSLIHRKLDIWTSLCVSLDVQILINPYVIFDIGTMLSYGGVIGIVCFFEKIKNNIDLLTYRLKTQKGIKLKIINYITNAISITLAANTVIMPIMIYNFNTISFTFVIANVLAGMLMGTIVILGFISTVVSLKLCFNIIEILVTILSKIAELCGKLPLSNVVVSTPRLITLLLIYVCLILLYLVKNTYIKKLKIGYREIIINKRNLCFLILCISIISNFDVPINQKLLINFVDVGQGDCTLIRYNNKIFLIDSGGSLDSSYDEGKNILLPYLLDRRINKIDYIIVSHFDEDHCQGFIYVMQHLRVKNAIISKQAQKSSMYNQFLQVANERKIKIIYVKANDNIKIGNIHFEILSPSDNFITDNPMNNNAIVCKLVYKKFSILFTGDIELPGEEVIIRNYYSSSKLHSTILKVGHHGSKTSTSKEFLKLVSPEIALIGVGENNKFGHPNQEVIERLKERKIRIYRTDNNGEISIEIDSKSKIKIGTKYQ